MSIIDKYSEEHELFLSSSAHILVREALRGGTRFILYNMEYRPRAYASSNASTIIFRARVYKDAFTHYKVTNDERRSLLKKIDNYKSS
jgi:hypothetical protein